MDRENLSILSESIIQSLIPGTSKDHLLLSHLRNWAIRELKNDAQGSTRREWEEAARSLEGLSHSARVRVHDDLADALLVVQGRLEGNIRKDRGGRGFNEGLPIDVSPDVFGWRRYDQMLIGDRYLISLNTFNYSYVYPLRVRVVRTDDIG